MKGHLCSNSLSGQPTPREEGLASATSSCSSLGENEHFKYPLDLLGVSWGSYLQSDPPTRGSDGCRSPKKVVIDATPQPLQNNPNPLSTDKFQAPTSSILKSLVAKDGSAIHKRKLPGELTQPHPLLHELHVLIDEVLSTGEEMRRCGIDSTPLSNLCDSLTTANYDLKQLIDQFGAKMDAGREVLSSGVLKLIIQYLRTALRSFVEEGRRLQEQAKFLQQTGRHLSKIQQNFMKEQEAIQHAVDETKAQLMIEKHELEEQKEALQFSQEDLRKFYLKLRGTGGGTKSNTFPGQARMVKEQSRLEKLLLQRQREIRTLQRTYEITKAELVTAQEHAHRMQQKLVNANKAAKQNTAALSNQLQSVKELLTKTSQELDREKVKRHEIGRMKHQSSEQQRWEQHLQWQLGVSSQKVGKTGSRFKLHTSSSCAGKHHPHLAGQSSREPPPYKSQTRMPRIRNSDKPQKRPCKLNLVPPPSVALPKLRQPVTTSSSTVVKKKKRPSFRFSKSELVMLASFKDQESADQVMQWLGLQAKLTD